MTYYPMWSDNVKSGARSIHVNCISIEVLPWTSWKGFWLTFVTEFDMVNTGTKLVWSTLKHAKLNSPVI